MRNEDSTKPEIHKERNNEGIEWILAPTLNFHETVNFYRSKMGYKIKSIGYAETDYHFNKYAQFEAPNGITLEIVEPKSAYKTLFTYPIISYTVNDLEDKFKELKAQGVEFISEILKTDDGWGWSYFRDPSNIIYQIQGPCKSIMD